MAASLKFKSRILSAFAAARTMRAWSQRVHGAAPGLLRVLEVPVPRPRPRDVVVRVLGAATNPVDTKIRAAPDGKSDGEDTGGATQVVGWDAAGVVVSAGAEARRFQPGDEVYFAGDVTRDGCHAEYAAVDERIVAHKPRSLSFVDAAALPLTALTAFEGLEEVAGQADGRGKTLLVVSGAGGVGSLVTQAAKRVLGFDRVVATASRDETRAFCLANGADATVNHREPLQPQLEAAGVPGGFDVIFNAAEAGRNFDSMPALLRPRGHLILITKLGRTADLEPLMAKRISVHHEFMFSRAMFDDEPERQGALLARVAELADAGTLTPRTRPDQTFDIARLPEATALQQSGRAIGKIVLDCAEWPEA